MELGGGVWNANSANAREGRKRFDNNRVLGTVAGVTTAYVGNYYEYNVSAATSKRYYYAGGARVAMRDGSTLRLMLSDHLGSTAVVTDLYGARTNEMRYKAWGEVRYVSSPTTIKFTGQRQEGYINLYWFNSRWYDPALGRFVQPDTIIPQSQGVIGNDRYAYSSGNPVKYVDPTGHKACTPTIDGGCDTFEEEVIDLLNEIEEVVGTSGQDMDNDGYPETPDVNAPPVIAKTLSISCAQSTYVECFYSRSLLDISSWMELSQEEMALLALAVYYDLNNRSLNPLDRMNYDTPLWDGYGVAPGDICYGSHCFPRQEVNYFAQGMYTAASGEKRETGLITVYAWKLLKYQELPSDGTLLWFDIGYIMYQLLAGR